jgi:hypothetical protein
VVPSLRRRLGSHRDRRGGQRRDPGTLGARLFASPSAPGRQLSGQLPQAVVRTRAGLRLSLLKFPQQTTVEPIGGQRRLRGTENLGGHRDRLSAFRIHQEELLFHTHAAHTPSPNQERADCRAHRGLGPQLDLQEVCPMWATPPPDTVTGKYFPDAVSAPRPQGRPRDAGQRG